MPDNTDGVSTALAPDSDAIIPRVKLAETGVIGLRVRAHHIAEDNNRAFRFPAMLKLVDEMSANPTVGAAMNVYTLMLSRVKWSVEAPVGASDVLKERTKVIDQCMDDMEHSWSSFITSVIPYMKYGFGINEKVFRRRLRKNGSKFNDGLVGIKKLPPRSQDSIYGWAFSDDGRDLLGVKQSIYNLENSYRYESLINDDTGHIEIPREKFLHFTADAVKGNPEGTSIFKNIYLAFKQLTLVQDQQLLGIGKDSSQLPLIQLPVKYLAADASPEDAAVYAACQTILDNLADGTQKGIIFPKLKDEHGNDLFTVDLLDSKGVPKYNTESIIRALQQDILMALNVDVLQLGSGSSTGSFSLADSKTTMLSFAIEHRLKEIAEVLNNDLVPQLFALNGWNTDEGMPKFIFNDVESISPDEMGAYIQRVASVGLLEVTRDTLNKIREVVGLDLMPADLPVDTEILSTSITGKQSGASAGMSTPFEGTAKSNNGKDNSVSNVKNAA